MCKNRTGDSLHHYVFAKVALTSIFLSIMSFILKKIKKVLDQFQ